MRVAVIGTGYVGLVLGTCLAETGNTVACVDIDAAKMEALQAGYLPIYEPGLEAIVQHNLSAERLSFTTDLATAVATAGVVFIAVGTPPAEDGSADLSHVLAAAEEIGKHLRHETVVVTKSTVPVGTAALVRACLERSARHAVHVVSNPEFMKEGAALADFMRPDRVVIGADTEYGRHIMAHLYSPFVRTGNPIIFMDCVSAELTKYAANAMLATRLSFMNEIAHLCERVGADVDLVRLGMGTDTRIGPAFLFPGPGYGGSCFPKDVKALVQTGHQNGVAMHVLVSVERVNDRQKRRLFEKLNAVLPDLTGVTIAVWGLAFKANTDDVRESPALTLIDELLAAGATVVAHDPAASENAANYFRDDDAVSFTDHAYDALTGAEALVVVTDWNEYRNLDLDRAATALRRPIIIDGRNLYNAQQLAQHGFIYRSIGT